MDRMHLNGNYTKVVKDNDLNGMALVFGDVEQLKELFSMTLGQWTAFRLRFWDFPSDPRQTARPIARQTNRQTTGHPGTTPATSPSSCRKHHNLLHTSQPS